MLGFGEEGMNCHDQRNKGEERSNTNRWIYRIFFSSAKQEKFPLHGLRNTSDNTRRRPYSVSDLSLIKQCCQTFKYYRHLRWLTLWHGSLIPTSIRILFGQKLMKPRVAVYLRSFSSDDHDLKRQRTLCKNFADQSGWDVVESFIDMGVHPNGIDRPGLRRLSKYVSEGKCDFVLLEGSKQISRTPARVRDVVNLFGRSGVSVHTTYGMLVAEPEIEG